MTATVVGVHGIGNHQRATTPDQAAATLGWTAALRRGLGQECDMTAVAAHHLAAEPAQSATDAEQAMLLEWAEALGAPPEPPRTGSLAASPCAPRWPTPSPPWHPRWSSHTRSVAS